MYHIPFQTINWNLIPSEEFKGETGNACWQTIYQNGLRLRIVEYSENYLADHWCQKGHIIFCIEGAFETTLSSGEKITLTQGMSYIVSDELSSHRSYSKYGAKLFVIDGDFLNTPQKRIGL